MDEQNPNQVTPSTPETPMPGATPPSLDSSRLSFQSIHDTLSEFHTQMKDVLTPENFERRLREKRRTLYTKFLEQEIGSLNSFDQLHHSVLHHPSLLDESSKNDVLRAILLEDVIKRVDVFEKDPLKNAQDKLILVRNIYDSAEKVAPEIGGVTPEWAIRKRREIRGGLAREIVKNDANIPAVESYIATFEQFEVNRLSADEEWKNGDIELARHLRQVMREKDKGELVTESDENERPVVEPAPVAPAVAEPVAPQENVYNEKMPEVAQEPVITLTPEVVPQLRKDAEQLKKEIAGNVDYQLSNTENPQLGEYFAIASGVKKGVLPKASGQQEESSKTDSEFSPLSEDFTIPATNTPESLQPDPGVIEEVAAQSGEEDKPEVEEERPFVPGFPSPDVEPEPTLAQVIQEDREVIETLEPHERVDLPIVTGNQPPTLNEFPTESEAGEEQSQQEPEKKKGFFSKIFGR